MEILFQPFYLFFNGKHENQYDFTAQLSNFWNILIFVNFDTGKIWQNFQKNVIYGHVTIIFELFAYVIWQRRLLAFFLSIWSKKLSITWHCHRSLSFINFSLKSRKIVIFPFEIFENFLLQILSEHSKTPPCEVWRWLAH